VSSTWHAICRRNDLGPDGKFAAEVVGWAVLVVREGAGLFAYNDRCPHQGARLSPGKVRRGAIMCPLHGARFRVETGECIGAGYAALRGLAVRERGEMIEVALPDDGPGPADVPIDTPA